MHHIGSRKQWRHNGPIGVTSGQGNNGVTTGREASHRVKETMASQRAERRQIGSKPHRVDPLWHHVRTGQDVKSGRNIYMRTPSSFLSAFYRLIYLGTCESIFLLVSEDGFINRRYSSQEDALIFVNNLVRPIFAQGLGLADYNE